LIHNFYLFGIKFIVTVQGESQGEEKSTLYHCHFITGNIIFQYFQTAQPEAQFGLYALIKIFAGFVFQIYHPINIEPLLQHNHTATTKPLSVA